MFSVRHFELKIKSAYLTGAAATALITMTAGSAAAQSATSTETVTVTGSRIEMSGFQSPTPLSVLSADVIANQAPTTNLADLVNQMPAVAGSITAINTNLDLSNGLSGINALNLRNLGTTRTLVLIDGHRSVSSALTGEVDVNDIPQILVQKVDIVTGGASAQYGSDAVGGVINFVLNKDIEGIKGSASVGGTTYGDGVGEQFTLAAGTSFAGDRGHFIISGELSHTDGVFSLKNRSWAQQGLHSVANPAFVSGAPGAPQFLVVTNANPYTNLPGGLILSSTGAVPNSLRGLYFGQGGTVNQFNFGSITNSTTTVGGDWQLSREFTADGVSPTDDRRGLYAHASYKVADNVEVYADASYYVNHTLTNAGPTLSSSLTLQANNPFVVSTLGPQRLAGVQSITIGTGFQDLPPRLGDNDRNTQRYLLGADGDFTALGTKFHWDVDAQFGVTHTRTMLENIENIAKFGMATNAVAAPAGNALGVPAGQAVCASSLTNPTNGCVPLNPLGTGVTAPAAAKYVLGNPYETQAFAQPDLEANLNFIPFSDWAGPVGMAVGYEHRLQSVNEAVPPQFNSGWSVGNFIPTSGHYTVDEGYLETDVPLGWGLNANGAVRETDYSTSGAVTTWKVGFTYQPIDDIEIRATRSHDIRAPNLNELFAKGTARSANILDDFNGFAPAVALETTTGNLKLKPEIGDSYTAGAVLTPTFIPGLSLSADWWNTKVTNAIGSITAQTIIDRCFDGLTQYCPAVVRPGGNVFPPIDISVSPFNFSELDVQGIDLSGSYDVPMDDLGLPGSLIVHADATNYLRNYTNDGIDPPADTAGSNGGSGPPTWLWRSYLTYTLDSTSATVVTRGVSGGTNSNQDVQCLANCLISTPINPTITNNYIQPVIYFDLNLNQRFTAWGMNAEGFLNITNLFNRNRAIDNGEIPSNPTYYDILGRQYRVGLRFQTD